MIISSEGQSVGSCGVTIFILTSVSFESYIEIIFGSHSNPSDVIFIDEFHAEDHSEVELSSRASRLSCIEGEKRRSALTLGTPKNAGSVRAARR